MTKRHLQIDQVVSLAQYMQWAHINFERFLGAGENVNDSEKIAFTAQWLASEYVVLEGFKSLNLESKRIHRLLEAYPEHAGLLRRCRNAVYHFQDKPLDFRFSDFMKNKNEELRWTVALHYEFLGYLMAFCTRTAMVTENSQEALDDFARLFGWLPKLPLTDQLCEIYSLADNVATMTSGDNSEAALDLRQAVSDALRLAGTTDQFPITTALHRIKSLSTHADKT